MAKNEELTKLLRLIKCKSELNQTEIAAKIGVSKQYLSDVVSGRYDFTDELRRKLYEQFTYIDNEGNITGNGNVQVGGNAHNVNAGQTIDKLVALLEKKDEQIDRLLGIIENLNR